MLTSKKFAVKFLVPFLIGAAGLVSGCGPEVAPGEDVAPESLGTTSQASTISTTPTESFSMYSGFQAPASWPTPITAAYSIYGSFDNNGANITATAVVTFSNGDPPLALSLVNSSRSSSYVSLTFSGTWVPRRSGTVTTASRISIYDGGTFLGSYDYSHGSGQVMPPAINAGGVVNASTYTTNIARGDYIAIFGSYLSASTASCYSTTCAGTQVVIGGQLAVITYASPGQVNAIVPTTVSPGGLSLIVSSGGALSTPYYMVVQ